MRAKALSKMDIFRIDTIASIASVIRSLKEQEEAIVFNTITTKGGTDMETMKQECRYLNYDIFTYQKQIVHYMQ